MSKSNGELRYVFEAETESILRYRFYYDESFLRFKDFVDILTRDNPHPAISSVSLVETLRTALNQATEILGAFFWECPPFTKKTMSKRPLEFVAIKSNLVNPNQDLLSFNNHFIKSKTKACSFLNLEEKATFISPLPKYNIIGQCSNYKNITNFTNNADIHTQCLLWKLVASELDKELEDGQPRWLSSTDRGVQYFHIRIDEKPRYYAFDEYKNWTEDLINKKSAILDEQLKFLSDTPIFNSTEIQTPMDVEPSKDWNVCKVMSKEYGEIYHKRVVESQSLLRFRFYYGNSPLTFGKVIEILASEEQGAELVKNLNKALIYANKKLNGFCWECPPVTSVSKSTQQFEFIANKSKSLSQIRQGFSNFDKYFRKCHDKACSFIDLGDDAVLVSPLPARDSICQYLDYKNIGKFAENSDFETQLFLWRLVASKLDEEMQDGRPKWLSTNDEKVHYLHIRIDKKPKYYTFEEYRNWAENLDSKKSAILEAPLKFSFDTPMPNSTENQKFMDMEQSKDWNVCKVMSKEYGGIYYKQVVKSQNLLRFHFYYGNSPLTFGKFIEILASDHRASCSDYAGRRRRRRLASEGQRDELVEKLNQALIEANEKLGGFFWECPPVTSISKSTQKFEFIANKSKSLSRIRQDFSDFDEHFRRSHDKACSFINLGGDAVLVSPVPANSSIGQYLDFKHIGNFAENSDFETQLSLWRLVASKLDEEIQDRKPRWLSTNGQGVHYLHIRIDKNPKYYTFDEYKYVEVERFSKKMKTVE